MMTTAAMNMADTTTIALIVAVVIAEVLLLPSDTVQKQIIIPSFMILACSYYSTFSHSCYTGNIISYRNKISCIQKITHLTMKST